MDGLLLSWLAGWWPPAGRWPCQTWCRARVFATAAAGLRCASCAPKRAEVFGCLCVRVLGCLWVRALGCLCVRVLGCLCVRALGCLVSLQSGQLRASARETLPGIGLVLEGYAWVWLLWGATHWLGCTDPSISQPVLCWALVWLLSPSHFTAGARIPSCHQMRTSHHITRCMRP